MYKEAFEIGERDVISIVGAGGKTTLMYSLANRLKIDNKRIITTTTTKILDPLPGDTEYFLISNDYENIIKFIELDKYRHITIVRERLSSGKLKGIDENLIKRLKDLVDYIIVEADGAARKPLKAPGNNEPVIPLITTIVIPVAGIDVLGLRLNDENVFRSEIASGLTGAPLESIITYKMMAILIASMSKGAPDSAKVIPFINKMEIDNGWDKGRKVGRELLGLGYEKVVLGMARDLNDIEILRGA